MKKFLALATVFLAMTGFAMAQPHHPVHHRKVVHHHRHHVVHHPVHHPVHH